MSSDDSERAILHPYWGDAIRSDDRSKPGRGARGATNSTIPILDSQITGTSVRVVRYTSHTSTVLDRRACVGVITQR